MKKSEAFKFENIIILIILLIFFAITFFLYALPSLKPEEVSNNHVIKIIDGDTFETANRNIIRLICIDSPEKSKEGYEEAKLFLENLILNKQVRLEQDISNTDKYSRLLRYVYVNNTDNQEIFVNKELVQQGYAKVFRYEPDVKRCNEIEG